MSWRLVKGCFNVSSLCIVLYCIVLRGTILKANLTAII